MKFVLYSTIALLISVVGVTAYSFEPQDDVHQLKIASSQVRISSLSYFRDMKPPEAKSAANMLAEKMKETLPFDYGGIKVFKVEFDRSSSVWYFHVAIPTSPDFASASEFQEILEIPGMREVLQNQLATSYCKKDDLAKLFRTFLVNGVTFRYSLYYKNQFVGNLDITKNTYCSR